MNRLLLVGMLAVIATMPLLGSPAGQAQVPGPPTRTDPTDHPTTAVQPRPDPAGYLATARELLDAVPDKTLSDDGKKRLSELRASFKDLATSFDGHADDWKPRFDDVERKLVAILGAGASLNVTSTTAVATTTVATPVVAGSATASQSPTPGALTTLGTAQVPVIREPAGAATAPGTVGATDVPLTSSPAAMSPANTGGGTAGASAVSNNTQAQGVGLGAVAIDEIGVKNLDPGVRVQLERIRRNIEQFFDGATRTSHSS